MESSKPISIILHGGAINTLPGDDLENIDDGVRQACIKGYEVLKNRGTCVDAVRVAVMELENNPLFNAGRGSCLTSNGTIEMDAAIMNGKDLKAGAVACVQKVKNPVDLALQVMNNTPHVLMVGSGATDFAKSINYPIMSDESYLMTDEQISLLKSYASYTESVQELMNKSEKKHYNNNPSESSFKNHDTVGAVAIDCFGNLAAATSSGGIVNKLPGRVGDVPIIGGGLFANSEGAASATGHGEGLLRTLTCRETVRNIETGMLPSEAIQASLALLKKSVGSSGGVVALDKNGNFGYFHTTAYMSWARMDNDGNLTSGLM